MRVYILYLRYEDAIFVILCMGLSMITTIAGEWLNTLIFHGYINVLQLMDRQLFMWLPIKLCYMMIIHFAQKVFEVLSHS